MKLLLRREQKKGGMLGKVTFTLSVRAELTPDEKSNIDRYQLGGTMLYERTRLVEGSGSGLLGVASRLAHKMTNLSVSVYDLVSGKRIDCKDIVEMIAIEEQIKEAAQTFKNVLDAAASFGGEEVVAIG